MICLLYMYKNCRKCHHLNHHSNARCSGCGILDFISEKASKLNNYLKDKKFAGRAVDYLL